MTGLEPTPNFLNLVNWELLCGYLENPLCCSGGGTEWTLPYAVIPWNQPQRTEQQDYIKRTATDLSLKSCVCFFSPEAGEKHSEVASWMKFQPSRTVGQGVWKSARFYLAQLLLWSMSYVLQKTHVHLARFLVLVFSFSKPECLEVSWVLEKQNESKTKWITFYVMSTNWVQRTTCQASWYTIKWQHFMP